MTMFDDVNDVRVLIGKAVDAGSTCWVAITVRGKTSRNYRLRTPHPRSPRRRLMGDTVKVQPFLTDSDDDTYSRWRDALGQDWLHMSDGTNPGHWYVLDTDADVWNRATPAACRGPYREIPD